jgi:hypothetical protein
MTDHGRYPGGEGYAWRGDWRKRLSALLEEKGFDSLTSYAQKRPLDTLDDMVSDLGEGDVAPIQLQWVLLEEARKRHELRGSLDLIVRLLREVKGGWPAGSSWEDQTAVRSALIEWGVSFKGSDHEDVARKMVIAFLSDPGMPAGWRPEGIDDSRITSLFDRFWPLDEPKGD